MQTLFTRQQLEDPALAEADKILRACVHCGFCLATCPTYVLSGNELESPRGRIYLIKDMLESSATPSATTVRHIDSCVSCLSCMTTCPSGVHYMHLVDLARATIERRYARPWHERLWRAGILLFLTNRRLFRSGLQCARALSAALRPLHNFLPGSVRRLLAFVPARSRPSPRPEGRTVKEKPATSGTVILFEGCVQPVLAPRINAAAERVLSRLGFETVRVREEGCCGALSHHMGKEEDARQRARANIAAWQPLLERGDVAAILVTASGCGTMLKDYGHLLREDPAFADSAKRVSRLARDFSEFLADRDITPLLAAERHGERPVVAYQSPCSLTHGQKILREPVILLEKLGFAVREPDEPHLCCGAGGAYNLLHPETAAGLGLRKALNLRTLGAGVVASANIGCMTQLGLYLGAGTEGPGLPVVHVAELFDWASGGEMPEVLQAGKR